MAKIDLQKSIQKKFKALTPYLDERTKRVWSAVEADSYGRGGISHVSEATGLSRTTIYEGIKELKEKKKVNKIPEGRIRKSGGGRKTLVEQQSGIKEELEALLEPVTRGDPESPLLWTCKSTYKLSAELKQKGFSVSQRTVCDLLDDMGYSLQSNRKTKEGGSNPDRDAQFNHIYKTVKTFQSKGQPVISVDAKKKELIGEFKNSGKEYRPKGNPIPVNVYDFIDKELGKVAPYGIYDQSQNLGFVNEGIDHDTAEFAVESIRRWWKEMGSPMYKKATELLITADGGGSNGNRNRLWKNELQKLSNETGLIIKVCHFPPGTSKWNKIEHRLFSFISINWRGQPLTDYRTVVDLISRTKTATGLIVKARLDQNEYEKGRKVTKEQLQALNIIRDTFHGEWNYTIKPKIV